MAPKATTRHDTDTTTTATTTHNLQHNTTHPSDHPIWIAQAMYSTALTSHLRM